MVEFLLFIIAALMIILLVVIYKLSGISSAYDAQSNLVLAQKECIAIMAEKLGCKDILPKEYFQ